MMKEMNSLHKNDTWELTQLSKEKKAPKWVFAKKHGSQDGDQVAEQNADDDEDQEQAMGDV